MSSVPSQFSIRLNKFSIRLNVPFLEPLQRAIADLLVPAITEHATTQEDRDLLELPVRLGGLGLVNPARTASITRV